MHEAHGHHRHGAAHTHVPARFGRAFAIGIILNVGFVAVEAIAGVLANSTALLADAGHNLSDVLGLVVAWAATVLARRRPTARYTYGFRSTSILAALFNAAFLLLAMGAIAWEAVRRLAEPEPVVGATVIVVALVGIAVNGATAFLFLSGRGHDINIRGAFLHMAADAAVSAGVVAAGLLMILTGWQWVDPAVTLVVAALIVHATWGLLRDSVNMSLQAVPPGIDPALVRAYLATLPGVRETHDLHIWPISTTETALTCHLVMPGGHPGDAFTRCAAEALHERFGIGHATLQIEVSHETECALAPEHVV
jgi:cobalt-zinc-cadmium efflux system protein